MSDQTARRRDDRPRVDGTAPGGPARAGAPRAAFVAAYAVSIFGIFLALLTPVIVTLEVKIDSIVAKEQVTGALSLVLGVGALLALFGNPLFGRLSDRTASRFGRRRPWILGGMAGGLVGLAVIATAGSVPVVLLGWCLAQLSFNAALAAAIAVLPDRVPDEYRGRVSGIIGGMLPLSTVAGAALAQAMAPNVVPMLLVPGLVGLVATAWIVAQPDPVKGDTGPVERLTARDFFGSFVFNPRKSPDFGWAWLSRFLLFIGFAFILTYQAVILAQDLGASQADVPKYVLLATVANTVVVLVASAVGGRLSDKVGRRKPFVFAAAVLYAASMVLFISATKPSDFVVAMGAAGLGYGLYLSADLALVTAVLPDNGANAAKDMGVFNIANALPQSIAPAIAPAFLAIGASGGDKNWTALFVTGALFILAGAFAILPVRAVR